MPRQKQDDLRHLQLRVDHGVRGIGPHFAAAHKGVPAVQALPDVLVQGRIILRTAQTSLPGSTRHPCGGRARNSTPRIAASRRLTARGQPAIAWHTPASGGMGT